jgi:hypothetical protein
VIGVVTFRHERRLKRFQDYSFPPLGFKRVHMIKLTQQREIAPYKWVHPDDDERR